MTNDDIHAHVGAYVLHALPDNERAEFETHLHQCPACQQEVRGLTETTALLGAAAAQPAPASLRERVRTQIGHTRQLPPPLRRLPPPRRWLHRATAVAAAACLAVAIAATGVAVHEHQQATRLQAQQRAAAAVLSAPDVHVTSAVRTRYGTATLAFSRNRDRILLLLHEPRRLAPDRAYQVWFLTAAGTARSAGLLPTDQQATTALVAGPVNDTAKVAVTVEPATGSRQPTTQPIIALPLP